jgi:hypothetical protein
VEETAHVSLDTEWITDLIQTDALLAPELSASIPALATALSFRVQLLHEVNTAFSQGYTDAIVDDLLPILYRAKLVKYIQSSSSVRSRQPETDDALLFFYKHLATTLAQQTQTQTLSTQDGQRNGWLRINTILHFFSQPFQAHDTDLILG